MPFLPYEFGELTPISMTSSGKFLAKISPKPVYQSSFLTKLWANTDVSAKKNFKLRSIMKLKH